MRRELAFFFYFVFLVALLCSRTLLTIAMIGIFVIGVVDVERKSFRISINRLFFKNIRQITRGKAALIGIFTLIIVGSISLSSSEVLLKNLRVYLPFLVLPLAFTQLPRLSKKDLSNVLLLFLTLTTVACIGIGINYLLDFEYITNSINLGKAIPTPVHHIRFSLMVALATTIGVWLTYNGHFWRKPWERYLIGGMTGFVFIFQHVLSVRSGLVVLYAALGLMAIYFIVTSRKLWLFAILVPAMFAMPLVAYWALPSLQNKVRYLRHDLDMMRNGHLDGFSDGQRFISWKIGGDVVRDHPALGVGFADLKEEIGVRYQEQHPELTPKFPHNQFLIMASGVGLVGLGIFGCLFLVPLFYKQHYRISIFAGFYAIVAISFMFENTLFTSIGMSIYIFFTLLLLQTDWKETS